MMPACLLNTGVYPQLICIVSCADEQHVTCIFGETIAYVCIKYRMRTKVTSYIDKSHLSLQQAKLYSIGTVFTTLHQHLKNS